MNPKQISRNSRSRRVEIVAAAAATLLFIAALTLPAFYLENGDSFPGIMCAILGWVPVEPYANCIAWLANPLFFLAILLLVISKPKLALVSSLLSVMLTPATFFVEDVLVNEGGTKSDVIGFGPACFVWIAGCALPAIGAIVALRLSGTPEG